MKLYVEGGGDSKELRTRCRKAFATLISAARPGRPMPRIVARGGRGATFDSFRTAHLNACSGKVAVLLMDSEAPVSTPPWQHLAKRDGWQRPAGASDDQCHLMVACMETWVIADRNTLKKIFGGCLAKNALLPDVGLELRTKDDVQDALEKATRRCPPNRRYQKGRRSFQVLSEINPGALKKLPHFQRLPDILDKLL